MATIQKTLDTKTRTVTFVVDGVGTLVVDADRLTADLFTYAALHGLAQKVGDAAAIERDKETGRSATPQEKFDAMKAVVDHLYAGGDWNRRAEGDGSGNMGLLVAALIEVTWQPKAELEATVAGWDAKTQAAMRADPAVAPVIARIKAERAAKKGPAVDTKALMAGLMAKGE